MACALAMLAAFDGQASEKKDSTIAKPKTRRRPAGYMGLMDANFSLGYMNKHNSSFSPKTSKVGPPAYTTTGSTNMVYAYFHFQESMLCNYFWADESDTRLKIGFQETLDLGYGRGTGVEKSSLSTNEIKSTSNELVFSYLAGLAAVVRINNDIDAGFTFYPLTISYFTEARRYCTFRFRYTNFMAEVSTFGKNSIDLKYMQRIDKDDRDISFYYGLSYIYKNQDRFNTTGSDNFCHISIGILL